MSALSEQDKISPLDPLHYAPRRLRERPESRLSPFDELVSEREPRPEPAGQSIPVPASLDSQLENAVYESLRRPLDPEVIHEPPELARELDRRGALFGVAARFAAAIGVSAVAALFFVFMVPASRQPDAGSSFAAAMQSVRAAVFQPRQSDEELKPALSEFRTLLVSTDGSQPVSHEQSEKLLQKFMQWRQKTNSTEPAR
jgi:hypothetical protein